MTAAHWMLGGAGAFFAIAGVFFLLRTVAGGSKETIDFIFGSVTIGRVSVSVGALLLLFSAIVFYFGIPELEQAQRTSRIETLESNLAEANGTIEVRDVQIKGLQGDLSDKGREISGLNDTIGKKNIEIGGLESEIERQRGEISRQEKLIKAKEQELLRSKELLNRRDAELEQKEALIRSLREDVESVKKDARNAIQVARDIASAENEADLSAREREELRRVREGIDAISRELSVLALREAPLLEIVGQPAVANYEIYARSLAESEEDALDRGIGLLEFESERFTLENYYGEGEMERLLSEIAPALCGAVNSSISGDVSLRDAIRRIPALQKYEGIAEPLLIIAEYTYLRLKIQALAVDVEVFVRGYADGERAGWSRPLPSDTPESIEAHPLANPESASPLANWRFVANTEPHDIGDSGEYNNSDLPNLRGLATSELLADAVSGCALPGQQRGGLEPFVEILDGKLYEAYTGSDRKARAFVSISLR